MVKSSVWKSLGGLDDRFFAHMEEIDLCWRMQLDGWKVQVVPASLVYHLGGATLPPQSPWKLQLNYRNNLLMLENNLARTLLLDCGNASRALRKSNRIIGTRLLLDWASALVYALGWKWDSVKAVYRAHEEFRSLRHPVTRHALEQWRGSLPGRVSVAGIWKGSILLQALLRKDGIFAYLRRCKYSQSDSYRSL